MSLEVSSRAREKQSTCLVLETDNSEKASVSTNFVVNDSRNPKVAACFTQTTLFLCPESSDLKINEAQQPFAEIGQADGLPEPAGPHPTSLFSGTTFGLILMGFLLLLHFCICG